MSAIPKRRRVVSGSAPPLTTLLRSLTGHDSTNDRDPEPERTYARLDEFDGYLAFLFPGMNGAILENPFEGNAVYAFDDHWRERSKLTKSELFLEARRHFCRIVHAGDWKSRLASIIPKTQD